MSDWRQVVLHFATNAEEQFDTLKTWLWQRMGWLRPLQIVPYMGYATRDELHLKGRVLEDKGITSPRDNDTIWLNLLNMYKRYDSHEIPRARVRAQVGSIVHEVKTDGDGFFDLHLPTPAAFTSDHLWHDIPLEVIRYPGKRQPKEAIRATGQVLLPPPGAEFGVISDIDDTVVHTDATNLLKMARNVFLNNARTRLPFEGVAAFYQALQKGTKGAFNPLFYVTSSAWNIYDLLVDFFLVRGIPLGPLFMIDVGLTEDYFISPSHRQHKVARMRAVMDAYADLPFILIGDSGQRDPEIYLQIVQEYPGRVPAVYIRDVAGDSRDDQVNAYARTAAEAGCDMLLVKDTAAASLHATQKGYILPETLPQISAEREQDHQAPDDPIEKLLDPESL